MGKISVLSPIGINRVESRAISGRIGSLDGAKIGVLNNNKPNSEFLQDPIVKFLGERYRLDAVVKKVSQKRITNSKDLRKLRAILRDPVAKAHFLTEEGDIESAMLRIAPIEKHTKDGLVSDLDAIMEAMRRVPWTTLEELKGNPDVLKRIDDAEALLKSLRKTLCS